MEFTRRTTGWFMPILITLSLSYILFLGRYIGGVFAFPGLSLETVMYRSYFTSEGMLALPPIFLLPSYSCSSFSAPFVEVWRRRFHCAPCELPDAPTRRWCRPGLGRGFRADGSVTGSAVANTVSIGVITIPMMKKSGFTPRLPLESKPQRPPAAR